MTAGLRAGVTARSTRGSPPSPSRCSPGGGRGPPGQRGKHLLYYFAKVQTKMSNLQQVQISRQISRLLTGTTSALAPKATLKNGLYSIMELPYLHILANFRSQKMAKKCQELTINFKPFYLVEF